VSYEEISESRPKARKEYLCGWCNESILVGEVHYYRAYRNHGDFMTERLHAECDRAMIRSNHDALEEGYCPGEQKRGVPIDEPGWAKTYRQKSCLECSESRCTAHGPINYF
jgi:hypothetical protein